MRSVDRYRGDCHLRWTDSNHQLIAYYILRVVLIPSIMSSCVINHFCCFSAVRETQVDKRIIMHPTK